MEQTVVQADALRSSRGRFLVRREEFFVFPDQLKRLGVANPHTDRLGNFPANFAQQ